MDEGLSDILREAWISSKEFIALANQKDNIQIYNIHTMNDDNITRGILWKFGKVKTNTLGEENKDMLNDQNKTI